MTENTGKMLSELDFGSLIGGPLVAVIEAQTQAAKATADFIKTVGFDKDLKPIYVEFKYPKEIAPYQPAAPAQITGITVTAGGSGYTTAPLVSFTRVNGDSATGDARAKAVVENGKVVRVDLFDAGNYSSQPDVKIENAPTGTSHATATSVWATAKLFVAAQYQEMKLEVPILTILPIPFIRVEEATIDFNAKINSIERRSESTDFGIAGSLEVKQRWPSGSAKLNVSCSYKKKSASSASVEQTYSMQIHVRAVQDDMPAGMEKLLNILEGAMKATPA